MVLKFTIGVADPLFPPPLRPTALQPASLLKMTINMLKSHVPDELLWQGW